nr:T9SS type A sorting domain-containing protein [Candidatus Cloacimonadota bacterium]
SATDGTNTWLSNFVIEAYAPVLWADEMIIDDAAGNNNGVLDPGETVTITIPTHNDGHASSPEAIADLSCSNPLITIVQSSVNLGEIGVQSFEDAVYTVTASDEITFGTPVTFIYNVTAGEYIVTRNYDTSVGIFIEDFESGGFTNYPWDFVGCTIYWPNVNPIEDFTIIDTIPDINWSIATDSFYSGTASAKSYAITHNQATFMSVTVDVVTDGEISFYYRVACEYSPSQTYFYDGLMFFIDDVEAGRYQPEPDGSTPWTYASYPVTAGTHTFSWVYVKDSSDGSTSLPEDCAWVDYIVFPTLSFVNGTIAGQVTLLPAGNIEDVIISTYYGSTNPDASGNYSFISPVGIFDVTASLAGYETITVYDVEVFEDQTTTVDFVLHYLAPPIDLEGELNDCYVSLNWEQSETGTRDFQHYNIYRNIDSGAFTLLDTTLALTYVDSLFESGDYGYYVTAEYSQENESDPTDTVIIPYVQVDTGNELIPVRTELAGNYPNPFNPITTISFSLTAEDAENAEIIIYNIKGQKVKQIVSGRLSAGRHSVIWNGKDDNGKAVSSGIYFYRMRTDSYDKTKRMVLLK